MRCNGESLSGTWSNSFRALGDKVIVKPRTSFGTDHLIGFQWIFNDDNKEFGLIPLLLRSWLSVETSFLTPVVGFLKVPIVFAYLNKHLSL